MNSIVFLTDVEGVLLKGEPVKNLSVEDAERLLPKIGPGMDKKVLAAVEALKGGAKEAVISSGLVEEPVTNALSHAKGTVISAE